ncbi:MAG: hypothetical protein ACWA41_09020 [Putridiphycobacter sp.]
MGIESNATSSEKNSSFYLNNENTCKKLEQFVESYKGKISGKYNASSYFVKAKIILPKEWIIEIKKSSLTSGNLLLDSNYQSVLVYSKWQTKINSKSTQNFYLTKSNFGLKIKSFFNPKINIHLQQSDLIGYNISNNKVAAEILEIIQPIITTDKISHVSLKDNLLVFKINSDELYLNELKNLIELTRNK